MSGKKSPKKQDKQLEQQSTSEFPDTTAAEPVAPSSATATPTPSTRRRVKSKANGPSGPRPTAGGVSIGFTLSELAMQERKRKAWLDEDSLDHREIKKRVEEKEKKTSDRALMIVLVFWLIVILSIFYHVYGTFVRRAEQVTRDGGFEFVPTAEEVIARLGMKEIK